MVPIFEVMAWQWERTTLEATSFPGPLLLRHRGPSRRGSGNEVVFWVAMVWQVCPCFSFPTDWRKCPHHNMYDKREPCGIHIKGKMAHSFCLEGKLNLHGHSRTSHVCKCHDGYIGRANHPECVSSKGKRLSLRSCKKKSSLRWLDGVFHLPGYQFLNLKKYWNFYLLLVIY